MKIKLKIERNCDFDLAAILGKVAMSTSMLEIEYALMCMGHYHSSPGTEGQRSRSTRSVGP